MADSGVGRRKGNRNNGSRLTRGRQQRQSQRVGKRELFLCAESVRKKMSFAPPFTFGYFSPTVLNRLSASFLSVSLYLRLLHLWQTNRPTTEL